MKKLIATLCCALLSISSTAAIANSCTKLNNTTWHSDQFHARINAVFFGCAYEATVQFKTHDTDISATIKMTKLNGDPECKAEMNFELTGTCDLDAMYPIILRDDKTYWRGFWAQPHRIGLDTTLNDIGPVGALLNVYMVQ